MTWPSMRLWCGHSATAVCRRLRRDPKKRLAVHRVAALDPGGGAAVDVADRGVAEVLEVPSRGETPLAAVADGQDRPITGHFVDALLQLPQRNQLGARHVTVPIFPRLADVQQEGRWLGLQSLPQLGDVDPRNLGHPEILAAGAQASPATPRRFDSVSKGQQYLPFLRPDPPQRLPCFP